MGRSAWLDAPLQTVTCYHLCSASICRKSSLLWWQIYWAASHPRYKQRDASSNQPQLILCVWPIWRVDPKKITKKCGWNYMKERYPVAKHNLYTINHISLYFLGCTRQISQTHRISCGSLLDVSACSYNTVNDIIQLIRNHKFIIYIDIKKFNWRHQERTTAVKYCTLLRTAARRAGAWLSINKVNYNMSG